MKLDVGGRRAMEVGEGNGPVNALDAALRKALLPVYPELADMRLVDFKVRILDAGRRHRGDHPRHDRERRRQGRRWSTIGVSPNIIDASYNALYDAITYKLFRDGAPAGQHCSPAHDARLRPEQSRLPQAQLTACAARH